ncbi:hypothetical protein BC937DRAFT_92462 [Endogone sp. FLAS-F59071]|nr:hypothetical protein BC937DRAFT_92462 [Endogone sp. FLAS-F59071]|eukprot:RUS15426.1 hypothetical protein BC937DRAFT_92462 [Endogone sp. FLAS-F59071]
MSNSFTADLDTLPVLDNPTILDPTLGDEIRAHLIEHGYALVKAMEPSEARAIYSEFWDWLEALGTGIKRDAPSTWDSETAWPDQVHGIVQSYGIGQAAFMWKCRTAPGVMRAFREVWLVESDEDLITSFDGAGMYPGRALSGENENETKEESNNQAKGNTKQTASPSSAKRRKKSHSPFTRDGEYKLWPHRDQAADKGSMLCVQGVVNLTSNEGKYDGGLVVWPGSHLIDWTVKYPGMSGSSGFFRIPDAPVSRKRPGTAETIPSLSVTLRAPAGTLMLWDSRTIHCNRPPTTLGGTRAVTYICMFPRKKATPAILRKRCNYYETWRTTSHWPAPITVNSDSKGWHSRNTVDPVAIMERRRKDERPYGEEDRLVRRLVGYDQ